MLVDTIVVFIYDFSYEPFYYACDRCAELVVLQRDCDVVECFNHKTLYLEPDYNMFILGYGQNKNRVIIRDTAFEPPYILPGVHQNGVTKTLKWMRTNVDDTFTIVRSRNKRPQNALDRDVDIAVKYANERNIEIGSWYKISYCNVNQHVTTCGKELLLIDVIECIPDTKPPQPTVLSFDIEVQSHDLISFPDPYDNRAYVAVLGANLFYVSNKISEHVFKRTDYSTEVDMIIGYNVLSFDLVYLYKRFCHLVDSYINISRIKGYRGYFKQVEWTCSAYGDNEFYMFKCFGRVCLDVMLDVKREVRFPKVSLSYVSQTLLQDDKLDMPPMTMFNLIAQNDYDSAIKYCLMDVDMEHKIPYIEY